MKAMLLSFCLFGLALHGFAQPSTCVILATNEPAHGIATWSREGSAQKHMLTYLAGDFPNGFSFRSEIKDKEVSKIKTKGGRVIILDSRYTREDLDKAKQSCHSANGE